MPLDFGLLGPPPRINTPFENLGTILQLRNQQEAARGIAEQRASLAEERRQKAETARQEAAATAQFKALWSRTDPATGQPVMPTLEEAAPIIGAENAAKVFKGIAEVQKLQWENQQQAASGIAALIDGIEAWPAPDRQTPYATVRQGLIAKQLIKPGDMPETYNASWVAQKKREAMTAAQRIERDTPKLTSRDPTHDLVDPQGRVVTPGVSKPEKVTYGAPQTQMVGGKRSLVRPGSDGRMYDMNLKPIDAAAIAPEPKDGPQAPREGYQWVVRNGEEVYTNKTQTGDRPQNVRVKPTEDERKSVGFHSQMSDAIKTIDQLEGALTQQELYQIQTLPQEALIGMVNRNQLSEGAKRYLRAFEQFTEARLRPVSGAAITDGEYARDRRTYAKQYGETPALAEDRKRARGIQLDSLKKRAGVAFEESDVDMVAPDGRPLKVPAADVARMLSLGAKKKGS